MKSLGSFDYEGGFLKQESAFSHCISQRGSSFHAQHVAHMTITQSFLSYADLSPLKCQTGIITTHPRNFDYY